MQRDMICAFLGLVLSASTVWAYSGGSGELNAPYHIATAQDLIDLGHDPSNYDKHFILTSDIDLSAYPFHAAVIAWPRQSTYSDGSSIAFSGSFNGQGHIISHLNIQGTHNLGLFGICLPEANISNLALENINIEGSRSYIGGVVGRNEGSITSVDIGGTITGDEYVGGIAGENRGVITSACMSGAVTGDENVGGIAGRNYGTLSSLSASGSVGGDHYVGGLVGFNQGPIISSFSTADVNGGYMAGGLAAYHAVSSITSCYSTGAVIGTAHIGGLVGWNGGSITSSYSTGSADGNGNVGGFVGWNVGSITSSYSTGSAHGVLGSGGFVGSNDSSAILSCFWDTESSGSSHSAGGTGLTTKEMQTVQTYVEAGWDMTEEAEYGTCDFWIVQAGAYPSLSIFSGETPALPRGSGVLGDPYMLADANDLGKVWYHPESHYRLGADIDLTGIRWQSAVVPVFCGNFDGNGHVVSYLRIKGESHLGLFGFCGLEATVSNLGLEGIDVNSTGHYVGGIVGYNRGKVLSSYCTGAVRGGDYSSGVVGYNDGTITSCYCSDAIIHGRDSVGGLAGHNNGTITSSYSKGVVRGSRFIGGFVGNNTRTILSSYSHGDVSGADGVGGFVGYNTCGSMFSKCGSIQLCFSTGAVDAETGAGGLVGYNGGSVALSFWNIETSGWKHSDGGIGLATAEMMDNEMLGLNGLYTDPNWVLESELDYPRLAWENSAGEPISKPVIDWISGTGTSDDPYKIVSADQLVVISKASSLTDQCFVLGRSLDLSAISWPQAIVPHFEGSFDGNDLSIQNMTIEGQSHLGLFGILGSKARVWNLGLENVDVNGVGYFIGGIAGTNREGTIHACYCTGMISGDHHVGALLGHNDGEVVLSYSGGIVNGNRMIGGLIGGNANATIDACYSTATVQGNDDSIGGLIGQNVNGMITGCYSTAMLKGNDQVGGLIGLNDRGVITASFNSGTVNGQGEQVGGLIGLNREGKVISSYNSGTVGASGRFVGGLVGENQQGHVSSCYNTGAITGRLYVGGAIGRNMTGALVSSYSSGAVSSTPSNAGGAAGGGGGGGRGVPTGNGTVGGLVGSNPSSSGRGDIQQGDITSSFWDTESSGQTSSDGGTGVPTADMQNISTFLDAGWDFAGESANGIDDIWTLPPGDYPHLTWEPEN